MVDNSEKPGYSGPVDNSKKDLPQQEFQRKQKYKPADPRDPDADFIRALMEEYPSEQSQAPGPVSIPFKREDTVEGRALNNELRQRFMLERVAANLRSIFGAASQEELPVITGENSLNLQTEGWKISQLMKILRNNPTGKGYSITVEDQGERYAIFKITTRRIPGIELRLTREENTGYISLTGGYDFMPEAVGLLKRLTHMAEKKKRK